MAIPGLAIAAGASLFGGLFGGGSKPSLPQWLLDELRNYSNTDFSNQFVPDKQAWQNQTNANVADVLAQLPVNQDAFNGQLASRGFFTSREGMKHLYSDVYAPIQRGANAAYAQGQMGYEQARQAGAGTAASLRQNALQMLVAGYSQQKPTGLANFANTIGGLGNQYLGGWMNNQLDLSSFNQLLKMYPQFAPKSPVPDWWGGQG